MAAYFFYVCVAFSLLVDVITGQLTCAENPKPVFMSTELEIEADEGSTITLPCVFYNITSDFQIYWYAGKEDIFWNNNAQTAADNYAIAYNKTNSTRSSNLTIRGVSTSDSMTYLCRASSSKRICRVQAEFNVNVNYEPVIRHIGPRQPPYWVSYKPEVIYVNETDNITLICNTSARPSAFITWVKMIPGLPDGENTEELSPGTEETKHGFFTINNVSRFQSGDYRCQATNRIGHTFETVALVVQYEPEVKVVQPDIRAAPGRSVTFGCNVSANPEPFDFYWTKDGARISEDDADPTPNTFVILKLNPETDYGNYTCVVTNQVGTSSATIVVSGRPLAPIITNTNPRGRFRHTYNLTWASSNRRRNGVRIDNIPVARYIIKYQRKDIQYTSGKMVPVLWPNEALSETVQGKQYIILRDLKENSSYVGRVCPQSDYGMGDCVSYTFTTSSVDLQSPATPKTAYAVSCSDSDSCIETWTPSSSSVERFSIITMATATTISCLLMS
ncbi:limbic system-associated membrane protein-like [Lytechinus pictus]|uniref:limbic system-associated membrane protein-like n=1 Tax=Lytechinus pictus TaxID=7653 RepID=UPI0030BA2AF4